MQKNKNFLDFIGAYTRPYVPKWAGPETATSRANGHYHAQVKLHHALDTPTRVSRHALFTSHPQDDDVITGGRVLRIRVGLVMGQSRSKYRVFQNKSSSILNPDPEVHAQRIPKNSTNWIDLITVRKPVTGQPNSMIQFRPTRIATAYLVWVGPGQ